jgi:hypothetical protein
MIYIPPKGLNLSFDQLNKLLVLNNDNIQPFMRVFTGIKDQAFPVLEQFTKLGGYLNGDMVDQLTTGQIDSLNNTSIIPYVRAGGSLTSGTASSFVGGSHLNFSEKTDLSSAQQSAFDSGNYGTDYGIQQTDEANSRA